MDFPAVPENPGGSLDESRGSSAESHEGEKENFSLKPIPPRAIVYTIPPEVVLLVVVSVTAETREASLPRGLYSHVETVPAVPLKDEPEVGHFHEGEQPGDSQRDSGTNREGRSQVSNDLAGIKGIVVWYPRSRVHIKIGALKLQFHCGTSEIINATRSRKNEKSGAENRIFGGDYERLIFCEGRLAKWRPFA